MKLSIIVPVYNIASYLPRCVESIVQQSYSDFELLLIDDGSTDESGALCDGCARRDARVRVLHRPNGGLSRARNSGIEAARGEFVTFVDGDDFIAPGTLEENMRIVADDPAIEILEYPIEVHHLSPRSHRLTFAPRTLSGEAEIFTDWIGSEGYQHSYACNKIFSASLFEGLRFPPDRAFEDLVLMPRLMERCRRYRTSDRGVYYYCSRGQSITLDYRFATQQALFDGYLQLYRRVCERMGQKAAGALLLRAADALIDTLRCGDCPPRYRAQAGGLLQGARLGLRELAGLPLPLRRKIKNLTIPLIGTAAHCRLHAAFKRRLNRHAP